METRPIRNSLSRLCESEALLQPFFYAPGDSISQLLSVSNRFRNCCQPEWKLGATVLITCRGVGCHPRYYTMRSEQVAPAWKISVKGLSLRLHVRSVNTTAGC